MGTQDFGTIEASASLKQVIDALADLQDKLNFLLNGQLDVKNLRANSINADRIKAKTITADRMSVTQLSAIAADLGTITAGIIYGAYIATANGTYPRIEFSSVNNLLVAYQTALETIKIIPTSGPGTPAILFEIGGATKASVQVNPNVNNFGLTTSGTTSLGLQSAADLSLVSNTFVNLNPTGQLQINNTAGYTGSLGVITGVNFVAQTTNSKTINFTKGIVTSVV